MPLMLLLPSLSTPTPSDKRNDALLTGRPVRRFTVHTNICSCPDLVTATVSDTNTSVVARCSSTIASTTYRPAGSVPILTSALPKRGEMKCDELPSSFTSLGACIGLACHKG